MIKFNAVVNVAGTGYWSDHEGQVQCTGANIAYINEDNDFGELRIYFDTTTWNCDELGLIYTDRQFISEIREIFSSAGFDVSDLEYSEQGMQGDNFVSMDVGEKFLTSWGEIVGLTRNSI